MPYCRRLLQADILPQNESRRSAIVIFPALSGKAWTSTGTFRSAHRSTLAMARSSPKLGSATTTPAIRSRWALNRSAHFVASSSDSTLPNFVSAGPSATTSTPRPFEHVDHRPATGVAEVVGEEAAIADDQAQGDAVPRVPPAESPPAPRTPRLCGIICAAGIVRATAAPRKSRPRGPAQRETAIPAPPSDTGRARVPASGPARQEGPLMTHSLHPRSRLRHQLGPRGRGQLRRRPDGGHLRLQLPVG